MKDLVFGEKYDVDIELGECRSQTLLVAAPVQSETIELGDTKIPKPYHPPTVDELTAQYFSHHDNLTERIATAKKFAAAQFLRLLLIVGDPQSELAHKYVAARSGEGNLLGSLNDFEQLAVPTDDAAAMAVLKQTYNLDADQLKPLSLVVLGDEGQVLGTKNLSPGSAANNDETLATAIADFTKPFNLPHPDAEQLLADAQDRARRDGKHVLLDQTGTYCGWCRILARFMDRHPAVFDANFVVVRIDDDRYIHGHDVMKRYLNKDNGGIPWCAILDADGKKLADCDGPDGNIGYPVEPKEMEYFLRILSESIPKITADQIAELRTDLEQDRKKYGHAQ